MNDTTYKIGHGVTWICGLSSWILSCLWVAMAVNCRLGLGHWPKPMTENYSSGVYALFESAFILSGYFAIFLAAPVLLLGLIIGFSDRANRFRAVLYGAGWVCLLCLILLDPTSFTEWWFD